MKHTLIIGLATLFALSSAYGAKGSHARGEGREELKARVQERAGGILDAGDTDGDGLYSESELVAVMTNLMDLRKEMREEFKESRESSDRARPSGSKGERRGPPAPEDVATRLIERLDDDADGLVSRDALEGALEKMGKRARGKCCGKKGHSKKGK